MPRQDKQKRQQSIVKIAASMRNVGVANDIAICPQDTAYIGISHYESHLKVRFRSKRAAHLVEEIDLSVLLNRQGLALAVAKVLECWGINKEQATRETFKGEIQRFWKFLDIFESTNQNVKISEVSGISQSLCDHYKLWLDNYKDARNNKPINDNTKAYAYGALRTFIQELNKIPFLNSQLLENVYFQKNPWPARKRKHKPREVLDNIQLRQIIQAAVREITKIERKLELGHKIQNDETIHLPEKPKDKNDYIDFEVRLKALSKLHTGSLPVREKVAKGNRSLWIAIRSLSNSDGFEEMGEYFYLTSRTIVPFIIIFACTTFFNPNTLLQLKWSNIKQEHPIFGEERWIVEGEKARAVRRQSRSFPSQVISLTNPVKLLAIIRPATERLRDDAPEEFKDNVFLFRVKYSARVSSFKGIECTSDDPIWKNNLKAFIKDNNLPNFALSNIRSTGSDLVHEMTSGDLKAQQAVLGHIGSSPDLTDNHYTSDAAKQRQLESLSQAQNWRERWVTTQGRADTRDSLTKESTKRAATPGFECIDPYDSPQADQIKGRLCTAFLACPTCSHAAVNMKSAAALVRIFQLIEAIRLAQHSVNPNRWLQNLEPELRALEDKWLPKFKDPRVLEEAKKITPPVMPEIE